MWPRRLEEFGEGVERRSSEDGACMLSNNWGERVCPWFVILLHSRYGFRQNTVVLRARKLSGLPDDFATAFRNVVRSKNAMEGVRSDHIN